MLWETAAIRVNSISVKLSHQMAVCQYVRDKCCFGVYFLKTVHFRRQGKNEKKSQFPPKCLRIRSYRILSLDIDCRIYHLRCKFVTIDRWRTPIGSFSSSCFDFCHETRGDLLRARGWRVTRPVNTTPCLGHRNRLYITNSFKAC